MRHTLGEVRRSTVRSAVMNVQQQPPSGALLNNVVYELKSQENTRRRRREHCSRAGCVFLISRRVDLIAVSDFRLMPAKLNFVWARIVVGRRERLNIRACFDHKLISAPHMMFSIVFASQFLISKQYQIVFVLCVRTKTLHFTQKYGSI